MKQKSKHIFTVVIILSLVVFLIWLLHPRSSSKQFTPEIEPLTTTTLSDTSNNYTTTTQNNQQK